MDRTDLQQTLKEFFRKYRWAALVLALGLLLMAVPEQQKATPTTTQEIQKELTLQQELEEVLTKLDGAGKVRVLLTVEAGERRHYQTDEDLRKTGDSADRRTETVIITSSDRQEQGLLLQVDPPTYAGAVVLCQGADNARVRLAVVEAVSTATGLGANKISVLKMK